MNAANCAMTARDILIVCAAALTALLLFRGGSPLPEIPHPRDLPAEADRFFYGQRLYPNDTIPSNWFDAAMTRVAAANAFLHKSAGGPGTQQRWRWLSMGPENVAGRIRAMAVDPFRTEIIYAGSAGGGMWKSTNSGNSWRVLDDFLPNLRIGAVAVDPFDTRVILAGNGEGFVAWKGAHAYGRGLYRSSDAGESWSLLPATDAKQFEFVFSVAFDPNRRGTVLAATRDGIYRSEDGGGAWTRALGHGQARGLQVVFGAGVPGLVYSAIESVGVFRSEDHGTTWSGPLRDGSPQGDFTRVHLAAAASDGSIVYAAYTHIDKSCLGVYRSADRGASWTRVGTPKNAINGQTYMGSQGNYNSALAVHPGNPDIVWAGGIDLYRSTNGGADWRQMSNWYEHREYPYVHADVHEIIVTAGASEILAATDGGLFRSTDGGSGFVEMSAGMVTAQFHSGTPHPYSDFAIGGTIDNGTLRLSDYAQWKDITSGDGGCTAINYRQPAVMYSELYYLHFLKSTDLGRSFHVSMNGIPRAPDYGTSDKAAFIAPFEMDARDPDVLYAGTYRLYKTTDGAEQWKVFSPSLTGAVLTAIGLSRSDAAVIYTGSYIGEVRVTSDAGASWQSIDRGLPTRFVTDIAVSPANASHAYISFSGFGTGHVFRTTDYGSSWTDISGSGDTGLPDVPVSTIVLHPATDRTIYAGTDVGLFYTTDGGDRWIPDTEGIGHVIVADLKFRTDGTLFAATHGRGMYRTNISLTDTTSGPLPVDFALGQNFPNPFSISSGMATTIPYSLSTPGTVSLLITDLTGRLVRTASFGHQAAGSYHYNLEARRLSSGMYFYTLQVGGRVSPARRMLLIR